MKGEKLKAKRDSRSRVWDFVIYPESLPGNWKVILEELAIPIAVSPLHDKDKYTEDKTVKLADGSETIEHAKGEYKKPHYHGLIKFSGKKSFSQVQELLSPLNCPRIEATHDIDGMIRYFCHIDNPTKAQYNPDDILTFNGMKIKKAFELPKEDYIEVVGELRKVIIHNCITEFYQFLNVVYEDFPAWACVAVKYQSLFNSFIRSNRHWLEAVKIASERKNREQIDDFVSVKTAPNLQNDSPEDIREAEEIAEDIDKIKNILKNR